MTQQQPHRPARIDPARLGGNGSTVHDPFDAPPTADYDALADLFLGDTRGAGGAPVEAAPAPPRTVLRVVSSEDEDPEGRPAPTGARIEGLIIGHLPVLASAWVTQYARHLAEQSGEWVGLVKLRAGQASVELVGPPRAAGGPLPASRDTFDGAIEEAARFAGRWLVRVDELTEPRLVELRGMDAVTLLTGADEAAVVASYRSLKLLSERAGEDESRLGVAIMGATAERAAEAAAKLARTVEVHLGRALRLIACVARIGPGRCVGLFRGDLRDQVEAVLPRVVEAVRTAAERARPAEPEPIGSAPVEHPAPEAPQPAPAALGAAAPTRRAGTSDPASAPVPSLERLAAHVSGLKSLPAPCPYTPGVELALDGSGRVHVLARMDPGGRVLEQLVAASAWVGTHAEWIRLAAGATPMGGAVMHVFTDEPRNLRRLVHSDVRVHLLVRAEREGWVSKELN